MEVIGNGELRSLILIMLSRIALQFHETLDEDGVDRTTDAE